MNKFKYLTKSNDGKTGVVTYDYVARVLTGRSINTVGIGTDSTMFQFSLSDGGFIRIRVIGDSPEIHYYAPGK